MLLLYLNSKPPHMRCARFHLSLQIYPLLRTSLSRKIAILINLSKAIANGSNSQTADGTIWNKGEFLSRRHDFTPKSPACPKCERRCLCC